MIRQFAHWLNNTPLSESFKVAGWLVPLSQCVHILCVALVMSAALIVSLRLLGVTGHKEPIAGYGRRFLPSVWLAYALLLVTGILQIIAEPDRALPNPFFQTKMILFLLVIGLTLAFQRGVPAGLISGLRTRAGMLGIVAMGLLLAIVVCGRWIAYATV